MFAEGKKKSLLQALSFVTQVQGRFIIYRPCIIFYSARLCKREYWARLFVCFLFLIILMFCMAGHENIKTSSFQNINIRQSFVIRGIESVQMHLFLIDVYIFSLHFNLWTRLSMSFLSSFAIFKRYRSSRLGTHSPSKIRIYYVFFSC